MEKIKTLCSDTPVGGTYTTLLKWLSLTLALSISTSVPHLSLSASNNNNSGLHSEEDSGEECSETDLSASGVGLENSTKLESRAEERNEEEDRSDDKSSNHSGDSDTTDEEVEAVSLEPEYYPYEWPETEKVSHL